MADVLVTGGCGYLGSQLIRDLPLAFPGSRVRILDTLQRETHRALLDLPREGCFDFIEGDVLDPGVVRHALREVETVVHLAAVVRTPMSFENPEWMRQVNQWGTAQLVEACLQAGVRRFVYASSTAVYGPGGPFGEEQPCRPVGPYASSKQQAEATVMKARERGLEPLVLRFGMLYGLAPAMRFDGVVNHLCFLAGTGRPLTIHGNGRQRRPVVHVRDASRAILHVLRAQPRDAVLNVVTANPSVLELAEALRRLDPELQLRYTSQDALTHLSFEARGDRLRGWGWHPGEDHERALAQMLERLLPGCD